NIQVNTARKIFLVQVQREDAQIPALQAKQRRMVAQHPAAGGDAAGGEEGQSVYGAAADGAATEGKVKTVRRERPKVGRNDPCPCGSGKKYKKCHGQAEAAVS